MDEIINNIKWHFPGSGHCVTLGILMSKTGEIDNYKYIQK